MRVTAVAFTVGLALSQVAHAQELVTNGDFEAGLAGWQVWSSWGGPWLHQNDCDIWTPVPCPYEGALSHSQEKGSDVDAAHGGLFQVLDVVPGRQYRVTGWWSGGVLGKDNPANLSWWEVTVYDGEVDGTVIDQSPGPQDVVIAKHEHAVDPNQGWQFPWESFTGVFTAASSRVTLALKTGSFSTLDVAGYHDLLSVLLLAQPAVTATKSVSLVGDANGDGNVDPGDVLRYLVTIGNPPDADALDVEGLRFDDTPGAGTSLVSGSVVTGTGTVLTGNGFGDTAVAVDLGTLAEGGSVTVAFDVQVDPALPPGTLAVSNQGTVTGDNIAATPTDDPATAAAGDPTVSPIGWPVQEVPTAGGVMLAVLAALLAGAALARLRVS